MTPTASRSGERGMALVAALLVLCVLTALGAALMTSVSADHKMAGHAQRSSQALATAEAGVSEALARIRSGEIQLPDSNPRAIAQIFLCREGSEPSLGADSTALTTRQPAGEWLTYSSPGRGPEALTVSFKTDAARTLIYRHDNALLPAVNTGSGLPIYVIRSTGREGSAVARIVTEVIRKPYDPQIRAALSADADIEFSGNAVVCGHNHRGTMPAWTGENGRGSGGSCAPFETGAASMPGSWTTGGTRDHGGLTRAGVPVASLSEQTGFYAGPWETLGMDRAEFYRWLGGARGREPSDLNAVVHLDGDGVPQNRSGSYSIRRASGEGMLYVDGDLTLGNDFVYRGLIYVEGDLRVEGRVWILGGLVVRGKTRVRLDSGAAVLYSSEAITRALAAHGGQFVTLSWREEKGAVGSVE